MYVIVRDNRAGVYAGIPLKSKLPGVQVLKNARHIWKWQGRLSTADIAARGLGEGSKVAAPVPRIELPDVVSKITCTTEARKSIEEFRAWAR